MSVNSEAKKQWTVADWCKLLRPGGSHWSLVPPQTTLQPGYELESYGAVDRRTSM